LDKESERRDINSQGQQNLQLFSPYRSKLYIIKTSKQVPTQKKETSDHPYGNNERSKIERKKFLGEVEILAESVRRPASVNLKLDSISKKLDSIQKNLLNYEFGMANAQEWLDCDDGLSPRKTDRRYERGELTSRIYSQSENSLQTIPSAR